MEFGIRYSSPALIVSLGYVRITWQAQTSSRLSFEGASRRWSIIEVLTLLVDALYATSSSRRVSIWAIFAIRLLVVIATIIELCELDPYHFDGDQTWFNEALTIWRQVMVSLSVITACIPLVKPFLDV